MQPLPDALRGEKWAFVQLPLGNVLEMLKTVDSVSAGRRCTADILTFSGPAFLARIAAQVLTLHGYLLCTLGPIFKIDFQCQLQINRGG